MRPSSCRLAHGATASYTMRFLWGHRAFAAGVPVHIIARVLGTPRRWSSSTISE